MSSETSKTVKFWQERFGSPECARNYHYYAYEYLDDLSHMPPALGEFGSWRQGSELLAEVSKKLKQLGWEGTGEFQMLWLPPFVGAGPKDNFGCYVLHVKQIDDGISWLVSPVVLPFHRLFQPDSATYPPPDPVDHFAQPKRKGMIRWLGDLLK